jgi:hypothetical protein
MGVQVLLSLTFVIGVTAGAFLSYATMLWAGQYALLSSFDICICNSIFIS